MAETNGVTLSIGAFRIIRGGVTAFVFGRFLNNKYGFRLIQDPWCCKVDLNKPKPSQKWKKNIWNYSILMKREETEREWEIQVKRRHNVKKKEEIK